MKKILTFYILFFACIELIHAQKSDSIRFENYSAPQVLKGIEFGNNSDKMFSTSDSTLTILLAELQTNDKEFLIVCHTDNIGTKRYNKLLSTRRAESVKKYLIEKGINKERISTWGYGDEKPIADNDTKQGRALNRRIEYLYRK
jgi:OmpA-OmpF porin, OOP family